LCCAGVRISIAVVCWRKYIKCVKWSFISLVFIISITVQSRGQSGVGCRYAKDCTNIGHAVYSAVENSYIYMYESKYSSVNCK